MQPEVGWWAGGSKSAYLGSRGRETARMAYIQGHCRGGDGVWAWAGILDPVA